MAALRHSITKEKEHREVHLSSRLRRALSIFTKKKEVESGTSTPPELLSPVDNSGGCCSSSSNQLSIPHDLHQHFSYSYTETAGILQRKQRSHSVNISSSSTSNPMLSHRIASPSPAGGGGAGASYSSSGNTARVHRKSMDLVGGNGANSVPMPPALNSESHAVVGVVPAFAIHQGEELNLTPAVRRSRKSFLEPEDEWFFGSSKYTLEQIQQSSSAFSSSQRSQHHQPQEQQRRHQMGGRKPSNDDEFSDDEM